MAEVFEAPQFEVLPLADDLHFVVRNPGTGDDLATVRPVLVGQWQREEVSLFGRIRRFKPWAPLPELCKHHVPRMVLQVANGRNSPLFLLDRADKVIGHPVVPDSVVVAPDGGVAGHLTTDHDKECEPPGGPVDSDGMTQIRGRGHLRDREYRVLCEVVTRVDLSLNPRLIDERSDVDMVRLVGGDGIIWARMIGTGRALHCAPQAPRGLKMLLVAHMVAKAVDKQIYAAVSGGSPRLPEPLVSAGEPYRGYEDVHAPYMRYQDEFIPRYEAQRESRQRRAASSV
ncbi:hypothetical protein [Actinomadura sp. WMMB 499]|uniref:hypothetical protein n=1 Tax=Actinomadura sp. WMMB 499 TaxID=1219491 RepID=UPI0012454FEB|nr:hypothetical protein [Actinomadura sp. WMMB 499]QFG20507.1 hypothetical protein F7P10_04345 [Actinomadura sp. WMMB 499]